MLRRGTVNDVLYIMLTVAVLITVLAIIYLVNDSMISPLSGVPGFDITSMTNSRNAIGKMIGAIPLITIGLGIAAIVFAFKIPTHPIYAPISFFLLAIHIIASTIFSNYFYNLATSPYFAGVFNLFPATVYVMESLPWIIAVIGILIIIVQYGKVGGDQPYG